MPDRTTADELLDAAQELIQTRGYNGFSFRDLSDRVGIRTASVHHHFPTKGDLAAVLVSRHRAALAAALADIDRAAASYPARVRRYFGLFRATLAAGNRMCLCGMLAAESATLPPAVTAEVRGYFEDSERWLAGTLLAGRRAGAFTFPEPAAELARNVVSAVEGFMSSARVFHKPDRFDAATSWLLSRLLA